MKKSYTRIIQKLEIKQVLHYEETIRTRTKKKRKKKEGERNKMEYYKRKIKRMCEKQFAYTVTHHVKPVKVINYILFFLTNKKVNESW